MVTYTHYQISTNIRSKKKSDLAHPYDLAAKQQQLNQLNQRIRALSAVLSHANLEKKSQEENIQKDFQQLQVLLKQRELLTNDITKRNKELKKIKEDIEILQNRTESQIKKLNRYAENAAAAQNNVSSLRRIRDEKKAPLKEAESAYKNALKNHNQNKALVNSLKTNEKHLKREQNKTRLEIKKHTKLIEKYKRNVAEAQKENVQLQERSKRNPYDPKIAEYQQRIANNYSKIAHNLSQQKLAEETFARVRPALAQQLQSIDQKHRENSEELHKANNLVKESRKNCQQLKAHRNTLQNTMRNVENCLSRAKKNYTKYEKLKNHQMLKVEKLAKSLNTLSEKYNFDTEYSVHKANKSVTAKCQNFPNNHAVSQLINQEKTTTSSNSRVRQPIKSHHINIKHDIDAMKNTMQLQRQQSSKMLANVKQYDPKEKSAIDTAKEAAEKIAAVINRVISMKP